MTKTKEQKYYEALVSIAQVLGTGRCRANKCDGCRFDVREAAVTARRAIGWEVGSKGHKTGRGHQP